MLVFDRILKRMREKVRTRHYVMTLHAADEMDDDGLNVYDIERVIMTGEIVGRQKDFETAEAKYLVKGWTVRGVEAIVVAKLSATGRLVILTVYLP
jgi:hypothetical protein